MNILPYPRAQPQVPRKAANILRVQPQEEVIVMSPVSSLASGDRRECRETRLFLSQVSRCRWQTSEIRWRMRRESTNLLKFWVG